jgi:hypothetical protein
MKCHFGRVRKELCQCTELEIRKAAGVAAVSSLACI